MRILHVISSMGIGGAERYLIDLTRELSKLGVFNEVLVLYYKGELFEEIKETADKVENLNMKGALDIQGNINMIRYLKNSNFDVLHVHINHPTVSAFVCASVCKAIYMDHGGGLIIGNWKNKLPYRFFGKCYRKFIAISSVMKQVMVDIRPSLKERIKVIHNGVNFQKILAHPPVQIEYDQEAGGAGKRKIGFIGRLIPQKGAIHFLRLARTLLNRRDDLVFVVVGDGPQRGYLEHQARAMTIGDRVLFLGARKDAVGILKGFDVMIFASDAEGMGIVLPEAMASGVPIVAAKLRNAVAEIISDGVDGFVVEGVDLEALADRVERVLDDAELRSRMIGNARAKALNGFTMERNAQQVYQLYKEVCAHG